MFSSDFSPASKEFLKNINCWLWKQKKHKNITLAELSQHVIRSQMKAIFTGVNETYNEMCVNTCVAI